MNGVHPLHQLKTSRSPNWHCHREQRQNSFPKTAGLEKSRPRHGNENLWLFVHHLTSETSLDKYNECVMIENNLLNSSLKARGDCVQGTKGQPVVYNSPLSASLHFQAPSCSACSRSDVDYNLHLNFPLKSCQRQ